MLIRVRTNVGVWRVDGLDASTASVQDVLDGIMNARPNVVYEKPLSFDPMCKSAISTNLTLKEQKLENGSMVHCRVDASTCLESSNSNDKAHVKTRRIIDKDGSIKLVDSVSPTENTNGFRKGMLPLKDIKKHWTLNEFIAMDNQYNFKIQRQKESWIESKGGLSIESTAAIDFQNCLTSFQFKRSRFGYLYGTVETPEVEEPKRDQYGNIIGDAPNPKSKVKVESIYEPPQEADPSAPEGFVVLDDPDEDRVERLAKQLGLQKVGWIIGTPPRPKGFTFTAAEIIMAAELQLEAADGVKPTSFVTIKVGKEEDGSNVFEAFQMSLQCMEMVAEGALEISPDPKLCQVNDTFTAIQESKESKTVENDFFLTVVPIVQHVSTTFVYQFPKANRDFLGQTQTADEMRKQLSKSGSQGWEFIDLLSDFHLLLYLGKFLSEEDIPNICKSVVDRDIPLASGYKIIIASMAGMDGNY